VVTRTGLSLGLALLVLAAPPEARANEARDLFVRGNEALSAGRRHEALTLFLRSLELAQRPSTVLNIAQCYRLLHFPEQALRYYQRYLESHDPSRPIRYQAEVREHIGRLQVQADLLAKARANQREGAHAAAIERLTLARQLTRWPGLGLLLARSYIALHDEALALTSAKSALAGYDYHLRQWREAGLEAPAHVQRAADMARRLVGRLQRKATPGPVVHEPTPPPAGNARPRSRVWLITAAVAGGLAAVAEIVAIVYYQKADKLRTNNPDFDTYRSAVVGGHVSAGILAAISATGVVLHFTLAPRKPAGGEPRGALVTATFRF